MTLTPMFKRCPHCGHRYTYNPSVGDLGFNCPKCGGMVGILGGEEGRIGAPGSESDKGGTLLDTILDIFK